MFKRKVLHAICFVALVCLMPLRSEAAGLPDFSPGVADINKNPLEISGVQKPEGNVTTTYGGASLTVSGSDLEIDAGANNAYSAGLAGYNAPIVNGVNGSPTTFNDSSITIIKGNLTSGMDNKATTQGYMNFNNSAITFAGTQENDAVVYGYGLDKDAGQVITLENSIFDVASGKNGTILTNYGTVNINSGRDNGNTISVQSGAALKLETGVWKASGMQIGGDVNNIGVYNINENGIVNVDGGSITSSNPQQLLINVATGGKLNVENGGGIKLHNNEDWNDGATINANGAITVSGANSSIWGGQLTIGESANVNLSSTDSTPNGQWATLAGYKGVQIKGGEITLGAGSEILAGSTNGMQITGGEITLAGSGAPGEAGSAQIRFSGTGPNEISGNAKILVSEGTTGSLAIGQKTVMSGGEITTNGTLHLTGSKVGNDGVVSVESYEFDVTGGTLTVNNGSTLEVANNLIMQVAGGQVQNSGTILVGNGTVAGLDFADAGAFANLSGGMVNIAGSDQGRAVLEVHENIVLNADNLGVTASEQGQIGIGANGRFQITGALTLEGANLNIAPTGTLSAGTVSFSDDSFTIQSGALAINGNGEAGLTGNGINVGNTGQLLLGQYSQYLNDPKEAGGQININVTVEDGKVLVANGNWSLGAENTIAVKSGSLQIGGDLDEEGSAFTAKLDVREGTLTSHVPGAADGGTVSAGIRVMDGGTLVTDFTQLFNPDEIALLETVQKIYLADNGAITVANTTVKELDDLAEYRSELIANDTPQGTVNWQDVKVTEENPLPGEKAESLDGTNVFADNSLGYGEKDNSYDADSKTVAVAAESSIGGQTLVLQGDAAPDAKAITVGKTDLADGETGNTLTLIGKTPNTNLIATDLAGALPPAISEVAVQEKATLQLGSESVTNAEQGGKLNTAVTLADEASLVAAKGEFETGAITALDDATATRVIVKAGSSLSAPVVGSETVPIATVENRGNLKIAQAIIATNLINAGNLATDSANVSTLSQTAGSLDLGSLTLGTAENPSESEISGGSANIKTLAVAGTLNVGAHAGATTGAPAIKVAEANLSAGKLVFDHQGNGMTRAGVESFGQNGADMDVLRNSIVTVGSAPANWADTALGKTGLTASNNGAYNSVLAVYSPISIKDGGSISVGGDLAPVAATQMMAMARDVQPRAAAGNTLVLGNKGVLLVNGPTAASGSGAIIPSGPAAGETTAIAKVSSGAKVAIADARPNTNYVVLGVNPENGVGWKVVNAEDAAKPGVTPAQVVTDNPLMTNLTVAMTDAGALIIRSGAATSAAVVFPQVDGQLAAVIDKAFADNLIGVSPAFTHNGARGTQFLSRALVMANDGQAAKAGRALDSAGQIVAIGAVPQMTYMANKAAGSAITQRTTLAEPVGNLYAMNTNGETINRTQKDFATALWIMPLFQSYNGFSMSAGKHDYDFSGTLGGVALGADYTVNDMGRFGVAFNIGGGYAEGSGTLSKTTNNMNFWGVGAYAGVNQDNLGLAADIFYTSTYNKLKQDTPAAMNFGKLKADVNGEAVSTGLRAEYKVPTDAMDIIPHAGFRYTNLKTDSYKVKRHGTVIKGDTSWQNIWQFPFGVTLSRVVEMENGWRFKPLLDLNVTPAAGDFKSRNRIRFTGTNDKAELETKVMDYITYGGTVGLEFGNDNLSVSINYNGEFGEETSAHGVFGTLRYEF